jgi:hypothetical protein
MESKSLCKQEIGSLSNNKQPRQNNRNHQQPQNKHSSIERLQATIAASMAKEEFTATVVIASHCRAATRSGIVRE